MPRDQELIDRVLARDPEAEAAFVEQYRGLVMGLARGRLGLNPEAADELLQTTFARLWEQDHQALRAWRGRGRFTTYLTIIVLRLGYRLNRTSTIVSTPAALASVSMTVVGPSDQTTDDSPMDALRRQERHYAVHAAMRRVSARDRLLLALRFFDERPPIEIARLLGRGPGATRKALHDALGRLRQRLRIDCPDLFTVPSVAPRARKRPSLRAPRTPSEPDDA